MNKGLIYLAFFALAMMVLQNFMTYFQYKSFQKNAREMQKKGRILGIGVRKGGFKPGAGAIVILAWNQEEDQIVECRKFSGIAFFHKFKSLTDYNGMSLKEVRQRGIEEDYAVNKKLREKEPYSPTLADKHRKKGALIQAVEAIDLRLKKESEQSNVGNRTVDDGELRKRIAARQREIRKQDEIEKEDVQN